MRGGEEKQIGVGVERDGSSMQRHTRDMKYCVVLSSPDKAAVFSMLSYRFPQYFWEV